MIDRDVKSGIAGVGSVFSWAFAHDSEIAFVLATTVSTLTIIYLVQGIFMRSRQMKNKQENIYRKP